MKKILFSAFCVFALVSCEKEEDKKNIDQSSRLLNASSSLRVYYDNGGNDYGCKGSGGNCLPDVIVTAPKSYYFAPLFESGSNTVELFTKNAEVYKSVIDPKYVDGVIKGSLFVEAKQNDATNTNYLSFSDRDKNSHAVYSLILK